MKVYVAGPMTGIPHFNFPAFDQATTQLLRLGHVVCNPAAHDRLKWGRGIETSETGNPDDAKVFGFDLREALAYDLDWIARNADAVAVLPGWEKSKGTAAEVALAHALGLIVAPVAAFDTSDTVDAFERILPPPLPARQDSDFRIKTSASHAIQAAMRAAWMPLSTSGPAATGANETRTVSTSGGEKGVKLARFDLIPAGPLWELATLYGKGAEKYAARNWERGYEYSKSYGALMRHASLFWQGHDVDDEEGGTGLPHMAAVAFHAFALMQFVAEHPNFDDRPTTPNSEDVPVGWWPANDD